MMKLPNEFAQFELDHIGIAVTSLEEGFRFYQALGFQVLNSELVPTEKVKVGMMELGNRCRLELLQPTSIDSPVQRFLDKKGPGVHHFALRVKDLTGVLKNLKTKGIRLINEEPQPGAHNCWIAFVHPHSTGGVLLELSEKKQS